MGIVVRDAPDENENENVFVDALLGTGFHGRVREPIDRWIGWINTRNASAVIAIDVPSGLDCDTGKPGGIAVTADLTVTFVDRKIGFDQPAAAQHLGRVVVADIGVPAELVDRVPDPMG